jgi:hypothetical protein
MLSDLVTADADVHVDMHGLRGHTTIVCSGRPVRIMDDPEDAHGRSRWRPGVHPKRLTEASPIGEA